MLAGSRKSPHRLPLLYDFFQKLYIDVTLHCIAFNIKILLNFII